MKTRDERFLEKLGPHVARLSHLKIGHWGDAVLWQTPAIAQLAQQNLNTAFWRYTRKEEIARQANELGLPNMRAYLSLDPCTDIPQRSRYRFGFAYFFGAAHSHPQEQEILENSRLVAIFGRREQGRVKEWIDHPKMCPEYDVKKSDEQEPICLWCRDKRNFAALPPGTGAPCGGKDRKIKRSRKRRGATGGR